MEGRVFRRSLRTCFRFGLEDEAPGFDEADEEAAEPLSYPLEELVLLLWYPVPAEDSRRSSWFVPNVLSLQGVIPFPPGIPNWLDLGEIFEA
jgi:hypothetical protein